MIAEYNNPETRHNRSCPQPYLWFYSRTLWEDNPLKQVFPKLNVLQNRALRAGQRPQADRALLMDKGCIERIEELAEDWSSLQKQRLGGTIELDDFCRQVKGFRESADSRLSHVDIYAGQRNRN
jgi:hypothetical protein